MASIAEHNDEIRTIFQSNKHYRHILTVDKINEMANIEKRYPVSKFPVCGHCERTGLWGKDKVTKKPACYCSACGTVTKNPITLSEYYIQGYDIDGAGFSGKNDARREKQARNIIIP